MDATGQRALFSTVGSSDISRRTLEDADGMRHVCEVFSRPDFVRAAAVVRTTEDGTVRSLYVNSSALGTVEIDAQGGVFCHSWETEDQAMSPSYLARCFPVILHNGNEDHSFALRILADAFAVLEREDLNELAQTLLRREAPARYVG